MNLKYLKSCDLLTIWWNFSFVKYKNKNEFAETFWGALRCSGVVFEKVTSFTVSSSLTSRRALTRTGTIRGSKGNGSLGKIIHLLLTGHWCTSGGGLLRWTLVVYYFTQQIFSSWPQIVPALVRTFRDVRELTTAKEHHKNIPVTIGAQEHGFIENKSSCKRTTPSSKKYTTNVQRSPPRLV